MRLHSEFNPSPGCPPQHFKNGFGWRPENLDARRSLQRLFVGAGGTLADHTHVELKGVSVRMDLNDSDLCSFVIHVLVESDKAWFITFDELN